MISFLIIKGVFMKRIAIIYIIFIMLITLALIAFVVIDRALAIQECTEYARLENESEVDPSIAISITNDIELCQVSIKAATNVWDYTEDGCQGELEDDDYCVTGFDTDEIFVERTCEEVPGCHAISHIVLYKWAYPTAVDWPPPDPFGVEYKVYFPLVTQ